jgi:hypothetical protein
MEGFFDRAELANSFDLSTRTIARWDAERKGPPRVKIGRKWYYPIKGAIAWRDAQIEQQHNAPRIKQ